MQCYLQEHKILECPNQTDAELDCFPFCSAEHHEYYRENLVPRGINESGKPKYTIAEMQDKLLEMANETKFENRDNQGLLI